MRGSARSSTFEEYAVPRLYIATNGLSVWYSDDLGETLVRMQSQSGLYSGSQVWALARSPDAAGVVLAGTETGLYRLDPATDCWSHIASAMDGRLITAIAHAPDDPSVILAGTQPGGLFRSEDGGRTWVDLQVPIKPYTALRFIDGRATVGAQDEARPVRHWTRITQIMFDPDDPALVFASVEVDHLWRSTDGGRTWTQHREGLQSADIHGLVVIAEGGRRLLASSNAGLHVSRDDGDSWTFQKIDSPWQYVRTILARPDNSGVLFATNGNGAPGSEGRLYRSRDFGATWQDAGLPGAVQSSLYFMAASADVPMVLFASTSLGQFYRSTDGGETWPALSRRLGEIRALLLVPE
jgi:photosystem II stability/assembly factor-like uncharacterized protein